jgi:hypothetical protein
MDSQEWEEKRAKGGVEVQAFGPTQDVLMIRIFHRPLVADFCSECQKRPFELSMDLIFSNARPDDTSDSSKSLAGNDIVNERITRFLGGLLQGLRNVGGAPFCFYVMPQQKRTSRARHVPLSPSFAEGQGF